ncbi:hypothetical protein SAMN04487947_3088 [Halogeometricum rufum]|uniref:Uncharacterized protein n=1 Tax=Halogeometricum rufum TaxID=553469 RepID=A0A1I6IAA2_9EURY|nr:hypothetical protein [Halogeometricum rufum]SFR63310.1 hypothetical protein SAMN04487947_3088 [Halogeometricum rufum]
MSEETPSVAGAFENVDFAEVFADTPLADEFEDEDATAGEAVGAFVGRSLGAWAGGALGATVVEPLLSGGDESEDDADTDDAEGESGDSASDGEADAADDDGSEDGTDDESSDDGGEAS